DRRARKRLRLLELASVGKQERLGGSGQYPNARTGRGDSTSLFEEPLGLGEATEVAELACEPGLGRRSGDGGMGDALDLFGCVSASALPITFDHRDQRE